MEKIKQDAAGQNQKPEFLGFPNGACKKGEEKRSLFRQRNDFPSQGPSAPC